MFSATSAGIAPSSVPAFVAAQLAGGVAAYGLIRALYPGVTPAPAADLGGAMMHLVAAGGSDAGISAAALADRPAVPGQRALQRRQPPRPDPGPHPRTPPV